MVRVLACHSVGPRFKTLLKETILTEDVRAFPQSLQAISVIWP
jgi:hypothetical protein